MRLLELELLLKKEPFYIERDEKKRQEFDEKMSKPMLPNTDIVYVDECGVNRFMTRNYARAKIGERVYSPEPGRRFKRVNVVGALINGVVSAIRLYNWTMTAAFFAIWFEWDLCTLLRPGSIIVMDNASFHKKLVLKKLQHSINSILSGFLRIHQTKIKLKKHGQI